VGSGSTLFVFAGMTHSGEYLNDLWACSTELTTTNNQQLLRWVLVNAKGQAPCARANHTSVMVGNKMWVFGGRDHNHVYDDLFCFDRDEMKWRKIITKPGKTPKARAGHSMVEIENKLVVFGGYGQDHEPRNDVAVFDLKVQSWKTFRFKGTPARPRTGHSAAVIHETKMLIFGGGYLDKVYNDLHVLDFSILSWSRPSDTGNVPTPRAGTSIATIADKLLFYGGGDESRSFKDIFVLDTKFFDTTLATQLPTPRGVERSIKSKRRKKRTSSRSPPADIDVVMQKTMEAESLRTSFESLAQSVNSTCTTLSNSINMTMMKNTSNSQLYQQHFISMINSVTVAQETELRRLNEEIQMFKDGVLSHLNMLQKQVDTFASFPVKSPQCVPDTDVKYTQNQSIPYQSQESIPFQEQPARDTEIPLLNIKPPQNIGKVTQNIDSTNQPPEEVENKMGSKQNFPARLAQKRKQGHKMINIAPKTGKANKNGRQRKGKKRWTTESAKQLRAGISTLKKVQQHSVNQNQQSAPVAHILAKTSKSRTWAKMAKTVGAVSDSDVINSGEIGWGDLNLQTFAMIDKTKDKGRRSKRCLLQVPKPSKQC